MAIEIKELVIRATVDTGQEKKMERKKSEPTRQEIVAECIEQVLEILRQRGER